MTFGFLLTHAGEGAHIKELKYQYFIYLLYD